MFKHAIIAASLMLTQSSKPMEHVKKFPTKVFNTITKKSCPQSLPTIEKQFLFSTYCNTQNIPHEIKKIVHYMLFEKTHTEFGNNNPYFMANWNMFKLPIKYIYFLNINELETINYYISSQPYSLQTKKQLKTFKKLPTSLLSILASPYSLYQNNLPSPRSNSIFVYNKTLAAIDTLENQHNDPLFGLKEYVVFKNQLTPKKHKHA